MENGPSLCTLHTHNYIEKIGSVYYIKLIPAGIKYDIVHT